MKTKGKILTFTTALMMMASILTGCSGSGSSSSAAETTTAAATTTTAASSESTAEMGPAMKRIKESGKLVMGTASGYVPYEFVDINSTDLAIIGVDVALGQKIADKLGVKLEVSDMVFSGLIAAISTDKVDIGIAGMTATDERRQSIDFSDVYLHASQSILIRKTDLEKFTTLESLSGAKVAVQKSTSQEKLATDLMAGAEIVSLDKVPNCVLELLANKADAVVIEDTVAQPYLISNPDLCLATVEFPEERRYKTSNIGVNKGNEDLIAVVNEVIAECSNDGSMEKWIQEYSEIAAKNAK